MSGSHRDDRPGCGRTPGRSFGAAVLPMLTRCLFSQELKWVSAPADIKSNPSIADAQ
jgi:hypothetical protein